MILGGLTVARCNIVTGNMTMHVRERETQLVVFFATLF